MGLGRVSWLSRKAPWSPEREPNELTEEGKRKYKLIALKTKMHNSIFDLGKGVLVGGDNRR